MEAQAMQRKNAASVLIVDPGRALFYGPSALPGTRFHIQEMSTKTTTAVTHYHIQKKRRAEFIEEWRKNRRTVIRKEDVKLERTARGLRTGVYMGCDGESPTRCLDALAHEMDPGAISASP